LYTDGVSEASNANQEDFGPDRIVEIVQQNRARSAQEIVSALVENVRNFSVGEQADDITVVVVKRI
jgi:sigma-B regulation protein RsbU (phosphoserine phosphatase)